MEVQVDTSTLALETSSVVPTPLARHTSPRSVVRLSIWVFAAFQFFYMLTSTGRARTADEYNMFYMTESLVLRGSTAIPQAVALHNFYGKIDLQGEPRAAYPPGQAIVCTPWYALGDYVLSRLPGVPAEIKDLVFCFSTCLSSATFSALVVAFFFVLLNGIGVPTRAALFAAALLGLATPVFGYSGWLFSEPLSAAIFMGVVLLAFGGSRKPISMRTAAIAGVILGLATWVRPTNVFAIAIFAVAVLFRDGKPAWRSALVLCACAAAGVAALLSRDLLLFGNPFDFGYPKIAGGVSTDVRFDTPLLTGLYGFLFSPGKSVFLFAPPLVLAIAGLRRLWRLDRGVAALAILFPFVYLCFFVRYSSWEGGYCVGPRYLVPSIAILCLGLGPALAAGTGMVKRLAGLLLAIGVTVQGISLATSFLEDQAPARGHYYDTHWHYRLSYSLSGQVQLLWKYLRNGQPPTLGLGWDRWFVFLHNGKVSAVTLAFLAALMLAGLAISIVGIVRNMRSALKPV